MRPRTGTRRARPPRSSSSSKSRGTSRGRPPVSDTPITVLSVFSFVSFFFFFPFFFPLLGYGILVTLVLYHFGSGYCLSLFGSPFRCLRVLAREKYSGESSDVRGRRGWGYAPARIIALRLKILRVLYTYIYILSHLLVEKAQI